MAVPTITPLPTPPSRRRPSTFADEADTWNAAFPEWTEDANTLGEFVEQRAIDADGSATDAQTAQSGAETAQGLSEDARDASQGFRNEAEVFKNEAQSAVATLPEGTIADALIADDKAWSSSKINALLTLDARATLKSDFATDEHFVDDGERTFAPAEYHWDAERASPDYALSANGKYRVVPENEISRAWNPAAGQYQAQTSGAVKNDFLWSNVFTNAAWTQGSVLIEPRVRTVINGLSAFSIIPTTENNIHYFSQSIQVLQSDGHATVTCLMASDGYDFLTFISNGSAHNGNDRAVVDLNTLQKAKQGSASISATALGNGISIVSFTTPIIADGTSSIRMQVQQSFTFSATPYIGDGTSGIYIAHAQLVKGPIPGPIIVTEDAPVTRAADNISRALGAEFNASEGAFYWEGELPNQAGSKYLMLVADSSSNLTTNSLLLWSNGGLIRFSVFVNGVQTAATSTVSDNGYLKIAASFDSENITIAVNGNSISTSLPNGLPGGLYNAYYAPAFGSVRSKKISSTFILPQYLAASQLQELTQ